MKRNIRKCFLIAYALMCLIVVAMLMIACKRYQGVTDVQYYNKDTQSFCEGWTDEEGQKVDVNALYKLPAAREDGYVSIFHQIPEDLTEGNVFCFFARHIYYEVYINGQLVTETYAPESVVYNRSPGHCWNFIPLSLQNAGDEIEIRFRCVYSVANGYITDLYIGREVGIFMQLVLERIYPVLASVLLLFLGVIFMVLDIPVNALGKKTHELLYLGWLAVWVALWCISETQLLQLFTGNNRMINLLSCTSLSLIAIPAVLYADEMMGHKNKKIVYGICTLSILGFVGCVCMHLWDFIDLKESLIVSHIVIILGAVYFLYMLVCVFVGKSRKRFDIYSVFRVTGAGCFAIMAITDLFRYYRNYGDDRALFVRFGLLIFMMCYGLASMEELIRTVRLGAKSEILSEVAYRDGLTGIWNRTWFQELLEELEDTIDVLQMTNQMVAIAIFDVNNLKMINDQKGHSCGDRMLIAAANTISAAFEESGADCFRIGGDEFAVVMPGENLEAVFEEAFQSFDQLVEEFNRQEKKEFVLAVAKGYAVLKDYTKGQSVQDVYNLADQRMYENKKQMKGI